MFLLALYQDSSVPTERWYPGFYHHDFVRRLARDRCSSIPPPSISLRLACILDWISAGSVCTSIITGARGGARRARAPGRLRSGSRSPHSCNRCCRICAHKHAAQAGTRWHPCDRGIPARRPGPLYVDGRADPRSFDRAVQDLRIDHLGLASAGRGQRFLPPISRAFHGERPGPAVELSLVRVPRTHYLAPALPGAFSFAGSADAASASLTVRPNAGAGIVFGRSVIR